MFICMFVFVYCLLLMIVYDIIMIVIIVMIIIIILMMIGAALGADGLPATDAAGLPVPQAGRVG